MKKLCIGLFFICSSLSAFSAETEKTITSQDVCIAETVYMKEVIAGTKYDSAITPYLNEINGYREHLSLLMADPYRCSLR